MVDSRKTFYFSEINRVSHLFGSDSEVMMRHLSLDVLLGGLLYLQQQQIQTTVFPCFWFDAELS